MQSNPATAPRPAAPRAAFARPSLAKIHARALYRFVPPVAFDDDGYPCEDSSMPTAGFNHEDVRIDMRQAIKTRLSHRDGVIVAGNVPVLFEEGNPRAAVVPDLFVAFCPLPPAARRRSFRVWENAVPALVAEVLSHDNWRNDVWYKRHLYQDLGIGEYWILDPEGYWEKPITGFSLGADGVYREIAESPGGGRRSGVLDLEFVLQEEEFRLRDARTGETLTTHSEAVDAQQAAEAACAAAEAARDAAQGRYEAAQTEIAELRERLRAVGET